MATNKIYNLALHDALPIYSSLNKRNEQLSLQFTEGNIFQAILPDHIFRHTRPLVGPVAYITQVFNAHLAGKKDRKSTRMNSSHGYNSYADFCLKKKQEILA